MKKLIITATALMTAFAFSAQADYFIQWQNSGTGLTLDGTAGSPITPNVGDQAIMELVFAGADGLIDPVLFNDGTTGGDDVVLATFVHENGVGNAPPGSQFGFFAGANAQVYGGAGTAFLGPSVYLRATAGPRDVGSVYLTTAVRTASDIDFSGLPPTPQTIDWGGGIPAIAGTVQLIPEPTSVAMIALGALTAFVRHRRRD